MGEEAKTATATQELVPKIELLHMSWTAFVDDKTVTDLPLARTGMDTRSMTRAMSPSSKPLLTKTTFVREEETAFRASSRGKMGVDGAIPYFDGTTNKFRANDLGRRVS